MENYDLKIILLLYFIAKNYYFKMFKHILFRQHSHMGMYILL